MNQSSLCFTLQRASSNHSKKWSHKGSWCSKSRLVFFTWAEFSCARNLEGTCFSYLQKSLPHAIELNTLYYAFISLQPDITAPGEEILAAYSPIVSPTSSSQDKRHVKYNILSGTSISCPHAAGVAAYVKTFHHDWSASAIKSAIMITGNLY